MKRFSEFLANLKKQYLYVSIHLLIGCERAGFAILKILASSPLLIDLLSPWNLLKEQESCGHKCKQILVSE